MPSQETVDKALAAIKQPAAYEYFFDQLTSPSWIGPLLERGFFRDPPEGEAEGEYIRFPIWAESRYLARMAALDPELVSQVLQVIPDTDNPRVLADILDALLCMPAAVSALFTQRTASWVDSPYLNIVVDKLGKLVIHLVQGGEIANAFKLVRALLVPVTVPEPVKGTDKRDIAEAKPKYALWEYQRTAELVVPILSTAEPGTTIRVLSELLEAAVNRTVPNAEPPNDLSFLWRSTIENSDQNSPVKSVTDVLIDSLRDAAQAAIRSGGVTLDDLHSTFTQRNWDVFRRLEFYLLAENLDQGWSRAFESVFDQSNFDNPNIYHEFWRLARRVYERLDLREQRELVALVEKYPAEIRGDNPEQGKNLWIAQRLAVLKDVLSDSDLKKYDSLIAELGGVEPERPDLLFYSTGMFTGPTTPKQPGDLGRLSVHELVDFLCSWEPTTDFMSPSPEGLARALASVVAGRPELYADAADEFFDVPPIYIGGLIDGWAEAIKKKNLFDWAQVIKLCDRIVQLNQEERLLSATAPSGRSQSPETYSQKWMRRSITYLLIGGFDDGPGEIPSTLRHNVWNVLEPLAQDPDPTPEHEREYGGSNMDPATLAINSTRGQAMHDVVRYALWVARAAVRNQEFEQNSSALDFMPEVRRTLDRHLDVDIEPSPAIRSVYGQWISWLHWLDSSWLQRNIPLIFPARQELAHLWEAAWHAYLFYSPIDDAVFELLRPQYFRAIAGIGVRKKDSSIRPWPPETRLAQHLMTQYIRGRLRLEDPIVQQFFGDADADMRREALAYVGRIIDQQDLVEKIPGAVDRATDLWKFRLARKDPRELLAFGWYFVAPSFPKRWALGELSNTLELTSGQIENDYSVLRKLADIGSTDIGIAVRCIRLMTMNDRQNMILFGSPDIVYSILQMAIASADEDTRLAAIDLVHALGARGYRELRSLLDTSPQ